jgi:hyperosmotically inducible protein
MPDGSVRLSGMDTLKGICEPLAHAPCSHNDKEGIAMKRRDFLGTVAAALVLTACAESKTKESTGQYLDDTAITTKVKTALAQDPYTSALDIQVETYKGVVQLSGFADSESEKRRAGQVAGEVNGVRSVKNDVRVKTKLQR